MITAVRTLNFKLTGFNIQLYLTMSLAHQSRRLVGELIVYPWSGIRPSSSTISNMNISATSRPIATKFYLKHHWFGGKAALGFGPDWIRTLVSMATESSHRVIMEKTVSPLFLGCFSYDPFHTCRPEWVRSLYFSALNHSIISPLCLV